MVHIIVLHLAFAFFSTTQANQGSVQSKLTEAAIAEKRGASVNDEFVYQRLIGMDIEHVSRRRKHGAEKRPTATGGRTGGNNQNADEEDSASDAEEKSEEEKGHETEFTDGDLRMSVMLLGGIAFIMALFYLVNHPDKDMKYYSWSVISATISIFVAVLSFCSIRFVEEKEFLEYQSKPTRIIFKGMQLLIFFCALEGAIALMTGAVSSPCLWRSFGCLWGSCPSPPREAPEYKDFLTVRVKCVCTLLAHVTGFAAIDFGGELQHGQIFEDYPASTFLAPLVMGITLGVIARVFRILRHNKVTSYHSLDPSPRADKEACTLEWNLEFWQEECFEAENDVVGLCVSFLLVQACRFNISGVLPDALGVEEEHYHHDSACVVKLVATSVAFAGSTVFLLRLSPRIAHLSSSSMIVHRIEMIVQNAVSMSFAWSLLYAAKWHLAEYHVLGNPNFITARLVLCLFVSFVVFGIVTVLDKLADFDLADEELDKIVDEAIVTLISSLGLAVGFSWEQAFDGAMEVIADETGNAELATLGLAAVMCAVVVPAWRLYILPIVSRLHHEHLSRICLADTMGRRRSNQHVVRAAMSRDSRASSL